MGRCKSEHEMPFQTVHTEDECAKICRKRLSDSSKDHHTSHYHDDVATGKEQSHVDEHTHTDKEIRNEKGIADELKSVHKRRYRWDEPVEYQAWIESSEYALNAY